MTENPVMYCRSQRSKFKLYWSYLTKVSQGSHSWPVCSNWHVVMWKYGLNMCHQCFCQYAKDIGFIKLD
ncbi:small ribosomal subunit protein uS14-like [Ctenodactylus gundi]